MTYVIFSLVFSFLASVVSSKSIPSYLHICHSSDPKLEECVTKSVENLREHLKQGIPELKVPSIEPLIIDETISTQGAGLTVSTKDLKAYGGGNFTIKKLNIDPKNHQYKFFVAFDHLSLEGNYEVDGKIIMIPIKGNGDMKCDASLQRNLKGEFKGFNLKTLTPLDVKVGMLIFRKQQEGCSGKVQSTAGKVCKISDDVDAIVDVKSKSLDVNGVEELRFTDLDVDISVGSGNVKLNNLFNGDKLIGEVINAAINLNFQYFIKELKPIISETLAKFMLKSANNICEGLPYAEVLPP